MAHFAKYGSSAAGHLTKHYERAKEWNPETKQMEYVKFGNQNIDLSRTLLNYNLAPERGDQAKFIEQRLSEVKVQKRADLNILGSWVVTLPHRFEEVAAKDDEDEIEKIEVPYSDQESREFFQATYDFLKEKYGEKNVVSGYVHRDEDRDHLHFAFLPIVEDKKWNLKHPDKWREKLSAKECVTKTSLESFHSDFQLYLDEKFGRDFFPVLNGATIGGNLTISEMKANRALEDLSVKWAQTEVDIFNKQQDLEFINESIEEATKKLEEVKGSLENTSLKLQEASQKLQNVQSNISTLDDEIASKTAKIASKTDEIKKLDGRIEEIQSKISKNEDILANISESIAAADFVLESKVQNISSSKQMTLNESIELIRRTRNEQKSAILEKSAFQFLQDVIFNAIPQAKIWWDNWQRGIGRFKQKQKSKDDQVR